MALIGPLKIKLQLACGKEWAFGPGKADLLEAIDRYGSISAAGRAMGMSYRRAWLLVDTMNRCWTAPLIDATPGGGGDRGARLTPCGRSMLAAYRGLEANLAIASAQDPALKTLARHILAEPGGCASQPAPPATG
jgi:molybdate transport system regulatory protein